MNDSGKIKWGWSGKTATLPEVLECVGEGWKNLVMEAWHLLLKHPKPVIYQVKEKFGGLRFYHSPDIEEIYELEKHSFNICEYVGIQARRMFMEDG